MKFPKLSLAATFLAGAICAHATTITLTGNLSTYIAQSSNPAMFAGVTGIAGNDPYSLQLTFNDALFTVPGSGGTTPYLVNALQKFELSVNGVLRVEMSNIDMRFFNDVGGRDSIQIDDTAALTMHGMSPGTRAGSISLQAYDASQSALQGGQPIDLGAFFDNAGDSFSLYVGFYYNDPYGGNFGQLQFTVTGDPLLVVPQAPGVPDTGATVALLGAALVALGAIKRRAQA